MDCFVCLSSHGPAGDLPGFSAGNSTGLATRAGAPASLPLAPTENSRQQTQYQPAAATATIANPFRTMLGKFIPPR